MKSENVFYFVEFMNREEISIYIDNAVLMNKLVTRLSNLLNISFVTPEGINSSHDESSTKSANSVISANTVLFQRLIAACRFSEPACRDFFAV